MTASTEKGDAPETDALCLRLAIVGGFEGTHVGGSLARAAARLGVETARFDTGRALGNRVLRAALWHIGDRRPARMRGFCRCVVAACGRSRPDVLIATGAAPLDALTLRALGVQGVVCVNYSTDDPWNPGLRTLWHLRALPEYAAVFTTRRANTGELARLGCGEVHYLPFGYDEGLFSGSAHAGSRPGPDVLFVGGADRDRVAFIGEFLRADGPRVALVGGYWPRVPALRHYALGLLAPESLAALSVAAKVNLCLVRRANRDGHVMRSFEIAAVGGCMLAEDTAEHRKIFGPDGEAVVYFQNAAEAAARARDLVADPVERARLAAAVRTRIWRGAHTYRDRLRVILEVVSRIRQLQRTPGRSAGR